VDWNSDGKKDIVTGENNGNIRIYLNRNTDAEPVFKGYSLLQVGGANFDCGSYSWMHVVDWNSDGLLDVLCGESGGTIFLMINEGALGAPLFNSSSKIMVGGAVLDVGSRSSPTVVDLNRDGKKDLLSGESGGTINYYENTGTNTNPVFRNVSKLAVDGQVIDVGYDPHPDVVDWDGDGVMDVLTGEFYGSIMVFTAVGPLDLNVNWLEESASGAVDFALDAGVANGGDQYFLACGISGTEPGKTLPGGLVLPCTWDFVTALVLPYNNIAFFFDFIGNLDPDGKATARFEWPGYPGSTGLMIYFAYCTISPYDFVSNGAAVEVVN
jgi:hypothetical protein